MHAVGVEPEAILLTHGHWDHYAAAKKLREEFKIPVLVHRKDFEYVINPYECTFRDFDFLRDYGFSPDDTFEEGMLDIAGIEVTIIHTPGHSSGSCCFYLNNSKILFSGDTLFRGTIGRTDLPCSEPASIEKALSKIAELPDETVVYPGHGSETTLGHEKEFNPYFGLPRR